MLTRPGKFHEIPWASEILHQLIGGKLQPHLVGLKGQSQVLCLRPLGRAQKNLGGVIDLYWIRWPESVFNIVVIITYIYIVFHIIYPLGRPLMYSEFPEPASQHKDLFICCGMNEDPPGNQVWLENPPYIDDFPHKKKKHKDVQLP